MRDRPTQPRRPRACQRRGFVLIVALVVTFAIASLVLTLGRLARTETRASANQVASYEAACVERGAEQYVLAVLDSNSTDIATGLSNLGDTDWAQVPVGKGYFWVVRPDYLDDNQSLYGLVDEASKIDLNTIGSTNGVASASLVTVFNMDQDTAGALADWHSSTATGGDYSSAGVSYRNKGEKFETVEEMLMVRGITRDLFFGATAMQQMGLGSSTQLGTNNDATISAGWRNFFTVWSTPWNNPATGNADPGRRQVNVNQAPREVLMALFNIESTQADQIITARNSAIASNPSDTTWFPPAAQAAGASVQTNEASRFVAAGKKWSADIVAASGTGRAFRRVRIVVDASQTPPQIVYRRDITADGWPLDPTVLDALKNGTLAAGQSTSSTGGMSKH